MIIDPGCYFPQEQQELKDYIDKYGFIPKRLLNTHCHLDHVFGNKFVAETWGLTLQIHEKEKQMLDMAPASGLLYDMPFDNYQGVPEYFKEGEKIILGKDEPQSCVSLRIQVPCAQRCSKGSPIAWVRAVGLIAADRVRYLCFAPTDVLPAPQ